MKGACNWKMRSRICGKEEKDIYVGSMRAVEKAMATHSSTLAWKLPWMEEPGRLQSMGLLRVRHDWVASLSLSCSGEGNGNPLQCSCLENPRDGGSWWAAVYGVTQSRTRLKWFSSSSSSSSMRANLEWGWMLVTGLGATSFWWTVSSAYCGFAMCHS